MTDMQKKGSYQTLNQQLETNTLSNRISRYILIKVYLINMTLITLLT